MAFNPTEYLIEIRGGALYLPVAARVLWFREEHPDWTIETQIVEINSEHAYAIFRANIYDDNMKLVSTGTRVEDASGFKDFVEKAETGAVGRALAHAGYGTQFAPEMVEGERSGDATHSSSAKTGLGHSSSQGNKPNPPQRPAPTGNACVGCGTILTSSQYAFSVGKFGEGRCPNCQKAAKPASEPFD